MKQVWVIKTYDEYYLKKDSIGTFTKNIKDAKIFKTEKDAYRDIECKFLSRVYPYLIHIEDKEYNQYFPPY